VHAALLPLQLLLLLLWQARVKQSHKPSRKLRQTCKVVVEHQLLRPSHN
jgi:hypothetical protein